MDRGQQLEWSLRTCCRREWVSLRRSGPRPAGHGFNCWETSANSADASGQYSTVKSAILTLFDSRESLLDCRAALPAEEYDFTVRVPGVSHAEREQAVAPLFRTTFGLQIRREKAEREVYVLTVGSCQKQNFGRFLLRTARI